MAGIEVGSRTFLGSHYFLPFFLLGLGFLLNGLARASGIAMAVLFF
jgi:hypothetical protein